MNPHLEVLVYVVWALFLFFSFMEFLANSPRDFNTFSILAGLTAIVAVVLTIWFGAELCRLPDKNHSINLLTKTNQSLIITP